jgi:hypothetical protein
LLRKALIRAASDFSPQRRKQPERYATFVQISFKGLTKNNILDKIQKTGGIYEF